MVTLNIKGVPSDSNKWELLISTECFIEQDLLYEVSQFMTNCFVSREREREIERGINLALDSMRCWFLHFVVKRERETAERYHAITRLKTVL